MAKREIVKDIFSVGAIDWDRQLFDELIPLPEGTSYNAFIVKGSEKTVLIDTVDPAKKEVLINNLKELNIKNIDYIVAHHAEQDHSGSIPYILELFPDAKIVTNTKCKSFLIDLLHIDEDKFLVKENSEKLSLGNKTLEFIFTPWVHWPETFCTYISEDKLLFSCDFFGSHLATSEMFTENLPELYKGAKRYFAEIMMPFRTQIKSNLAKIEEKKIDYILPSHGPFYNKPDFIINAYKEWISDNVKNEVIIPYVSMHESTKVIVDFLIDELIASGINVKPFNLSKADIGEIAMSLVDAATIIIASPVVLAGAHPEAAYATFLVNALRPKTKFVTIVGSYGWGGKMVEQLSSMLTNIKPEIIPPYLVKGLPKQNDFDELKKIINEIAKRHKEINILK